MAMVPQWSSSVYCMIHSKNMLNNVGDKRHPSHTPTDVLNKVLFYC